MASTVAPTSDRPAVPEPASSHPPIPPLENGDRLSRAEFERRYEAMPREVKAELVEGVVRVFKPGGIRQYGQPCMRAVAWLGQYEAGTPGVLSARNPTVRLDLDNEPQPDALLMIDPARGGQARISEDDFVEGAPELVVEVASSSVSYDLGDKLKVYRRNGVREYVVWRVQDRAVDWFVQNEGRYEPQAPDEAGLLRSRVFPGLWLDPAALLRGDLARVLEVVREGLASPGHAEFVGRLGGAP
jgi:Uma2 family endonuclease